MRATHISPTGTPPTSPRTPTENPRSSLSSVAQELAEHLPPPLAPQNSALSPDNAFILVQALIQSNPYARMALQEASAHSKAFAPLNTPEILPQFFRAKTALQLPEATAVLAALNAEDPNLPSSSQILANVIDRHLHTLIQNTLEAFEQNNNPEAVTKLGQFALTLLQHPSANTRAFWKHPFHQETIDQIDALSEAVLNLDQPTHVQLSRWAIKAEALRIVNAGGNIENLDNLSLMLTDDKDFMLAFIDQHGGDSLSIASETLKNDPELVLHAIQNNPLALRHASPNLRNNKAIVQVAVKQNGLALAYTSTALKSDWDLAFAAVNNHGHALHYVSPHLQNNKTMVLAAVTRHGLALAFAGPTLQADKEVVLMAISRTSFAFAHAHETLQNDPDIRHAADWD
jgi:Domain of unknown function (DUF4116)